MEKRTISSIYPERFLEFMSGVKRWKNLPMQENLRNVQRFFTWYEQGRVLEYVEDIQLRDIMDYMIYLSKQPAWPTSRTPWGLLAPSTIQHNINSIKNFFKFTNSYYDCGLEATRIISPKVPKNKVNFLTYEEILWLVNHIQITADRQDSMMRDLLLVKVAFTTWMRKSEIANLKFTDILHAQNEIQIIGKGDKVRTVFFTDSLKRDLFEYREMRKNPRQWSKRAPSSPCDDQDYIFICHSDPYYWKPLSSQSLHTTIKQYESAFKEVFFHWFSLHSFRHWFATEAIKAGTQLAYLKELLWHSDISTTMWYIHLNNSELYKARKSIPKLE